MKKITFCLFILISFISCNAPPDGASNGISRLANLSDDDSENNQVLFSQMWVWEYHIEQESEDKIRIKKDGKIELYYNPQKKYWLFTKSGALGILGEMTNWIIGRPDGSYITSVMPEFPGEDTLIDIEQVESVLPNSLPANFKPTGDKKTFNDNNWGFEKITGDEYLAEEASDYPKHTLYFAPYQVDFSPIYNFSKRKSEIQLAYEFPENIPANMLLLEETRDIRSGQYTFNFIGISNTEYYIDMPAQ